MSTATDIQWGDKVYYRGEVWEVTRVGLNEEKDEYVWMRREVTPGWREFAKARPFRVQRVEQLT